MSSSEAAAPAHALPRVVGILGAGRAGTALARAIARIPRLSPGTAAPRVMVAGTRRPAAVQRHLAIYAPEAVAVSAEDLAAEAELVVVAVPREALDDVDPLTLAGPATRAVVDLTNTWGDEPVPAWLDDDGAPGTVRIAERWAAAGLRVPVVRAFSEISHHDLEDAGRAARDGAESAERTAETVTEHPVFEGIARGGFVMSGLVHVLIGWFALRVALGHDERHLS